MRHRNTCVVPHWSYVAEVGPSYLLNFAIRLAVRRVLNGFMQTCVNELAVVNSQRANGVLICTHQL